MYCRRRKVMKLKMNIYRNVYNTEIKKMVEPFDNYSQRFNENHVDNKVPEMVSIFNFDEEKIASAIDKAHQRAETISESAVKNSNTLLTQYFSENIDFSNVDKSSSNSSNHSNFINPQNANKKIKTSQVESSYPMSDSNIISKMNNFIGMISSEIKQNSPKKNTQNLIVSIQDMAQASLDSMKEDDKAESLNHGKDLSFPYIVHSQPLENVWSKKLTNLFDSFLIKSVNETAVKKDIGIQENEKKYETNLEMNTEKLSSIPNASVNNPVILSSNKENHVKEIFNYHDLPNLFHETRNMFDSYIPEGMKSNHTTIPDKEQAVNALLSLSMHLKSTHS